MLQSSHVGIQNLHKASYVVKNWKEGKLMSFQKTVKGQNMREKLGAGSHIMIQAISSNTHASVNASNLQTPLKSKS